MKIIALINRGEKFGTLNDVIRKEVAQHLKRGTAKLLIDYELTE